MLPQRPTRVSIRPDWSSHVFPAASLRHIWIDEGDFRVVFSKMVEVAPYIVNGFYWSGSNRQSLPEKADRQRTFGGITIANSFSMALALGNGLPPVMAQRCLLSRLVRCERRMTKHEGMCRAKQVQRTRPEKLRE